MTIKFKNGKSLTKNDIDFSESHLGISFPGEFREFILTRNGATPEDNIFDIRPGIEGGISRLIPIAEIPGEIKRVENCPISTIPIAWAEGGNYVLINCSLGNVLYWDHENPEAITKMADSFLEFLSKLRSFDPRSVKPAPGQVKKAWIDPEFLKKFQK